VLRLGRRFDAILSIAAAWAIASAAVGGLVGLALAFGRLGPAVPGPSSPALLQLVRAANAGISAGVFLGGLSGLTFAGMVAWMERRREVHTLSAGRLCAWGAVAGVLWPLLGLGAAWLWGSPARGHPVDVLRLVANALVGACFGGLTLELAQRRTPATVTADDGPDGVPRIRECVDAEPSHPPGARPAADRVDARVPTP
jgi:hypothetical protein